MPEKIDIIAIDKALYHCFAALDLADAEYVIVVQHKSACAIGSNIEAPQRLMAAALHVMTSREPDVRDFTDDIGAAKGHA